MTYKSALAGLPLGGGKSVIIGDPHQGKNPGLLRAMGDFVETLGGRYVAAEDSGTCVADMKTMSERTSYVSGLDENDNEHGGDPSPNTAWGVYLSIRTAVSHKLGLDSLEGLSVAIQGLGHVGFYLAKYLIDDGATVYGADVNRDNIDHAVSELGVIEVKTSKILSMAVDVLAPCAMGAVLNQETIPSLQTTIIAGAANNQLATIEDGKTLADMGVLYCPDFLINAGGIIDVHHQRANSSDDVKRQHLEKIGITLKEVLIRADKLALPTQDIAESMAKEYLKTIIDKTTTI
jgi:leucine dehydrogenase